ncbi:MAG: helix-turn-helix domain-containing protein [Cyanobacteriota bacterium]|nr:helix-turn-helix domain-containing protein [Cyanobacteriota bacterium]
MTPPILRQFDSIDELAQLVGQAIFPMEVVQLTPGRLRDRLVKIECRPLDLLMIQANLPLLSRGSKPQRWLQCGLNLAPIPAGPVELQSHGEAAGEGDLYGLRPHTEAYLISPAGYHSVFITLPRALFFELAESYGLPDLEGPLQRLNTVTLEPGRLQELRRLLRQVLRLAVQQPQLLGRPSLRQRLVGDLVPLLQEALVDGLERRRGQRPPTAPRIDLVKQVDRWLQANPNRDINLDALCREVHSSRRTLIRGFREHLGLGPMQFLKLYRLHGVRRELRRSDGQLIQVAGVAGQWGFHSPGHFARDYQALFGERPSETLRRVA